MKTIWAFFYLFLSGFVRTLLLADDKNRTELPFNFKLNFLRKFLKHYIPVRRGIFWENTSHDGYLNM